jgi:hypothetical protein
MYGRIEHRQSGSALTAEGGTYRVQSRHRRGVPRADVRVERRRVLERLRAESDAVHADGKCSEVRRGYTWAWPKSRTLGNAHLYALALALALAHVDAHMCASVVYPYIKLGIDRAI